MAKVTNAFTTYQATANREDLSNAIYNIDPFDTPVMSAIRRRNVKNRIFDWQTENLPTVAPPTTRLQRPVRRLPALQRPGPADHPAKQRHADLRARRHRVGNPGRSRRRRQRLGNGAPDGARLQGAQVRHGDGILCSRQPRVDGNDTGPTARITEGFAHWVGASATPRTGQAAGAGGAVAGVVTGLPVARHRRLRCGRRRLPDPGLGSHARPGDAERLHQRREPQPCGSCRRGRRGRYHVRRPKHDAGLRWQDGGGVRPSTSSPPTSAGSRSRRRGGCRPTSRS